MSDFTELEPPPGSRTAMRAMEIARIWIVDRKQQVSLSGDLWDDPGAWGLMLMDLAHHAANAYESQDHDRTEVLRRILQAFDAERSHPTGDVEQLS